MLALVRHIPLEQAQVLLAELELEPLVALEQAEESEQLEVPVQEVQAQVRQEPPTSLSRLVVLAAQAVPEEPALQEHQALRVPQELQAHPEPQAQE